MKTKEKVFDDIARIAGGTVSVISGMGHNIHEDVKSRVEEMADRMDLVPREDLTRVEMRVEALEKELQELKKSISVTKPKAKKK